MKITVTGATGFIGSHLVESLLRDGHTVTALSRTEKEHNPAVRWSAWEGMAGLPPADTLVDADAVVNLVGEPISQKWTPEVKRRIRESRVQSTTHLVQALSKLARKPPVLLFGSAIGIYGSRGDEEIDESSAPGEGFLAEVCREWEAQADLADSHGSRVVKLRAGVVLGKDGGALPKMLAPFKSGVGGRIGSGKQWMSWIHIDDLIGLMRHIFEQPITGPVNGTAPTPVTNGEFTKQFGTALGRPSVFPVPEFALKAMFGEMADILITGQRVLPKVALSTGYKFAFPELEGALKDLL